MPAQSALSARWSFHILMMTGAMVAAKDRLADIHAVANDPAFAMSAGRRQGLNGAFEGVKHVFDARHGYRE
jgi:hypothetical protein